jgi:hypothetical protein
VLEIIRGHLNQPEYLHVFLHPLPIYGLALGAMALLLAIALRSRPAHIVALFLIFVCALSAWPVAKFGEEGYDRIESMADRDGAAWLDAHAQRATRVLPIFYVLAGVAFLALLIPWKFPKTSLPLLSLTLVTTLVALAAGAWIGYAGGQTRHKEFRYGKPSEPLGGYEKMRQ